MKFGGEEACSAELKTKLKGLIEAASRTDSGDCWDMIKGKDAQKLLARYCRLATRESKTPIEPAWPGKSAGRAVLRSWLRDHFPMA